MIKKKRFLRLKEEKNSTEPLNEGINLAQPGEGGTAHQDLRPGVKGGICEKKRWGVAKKPKT